MNPASINNLRGSWLVKLCVCACCGEAKKTSDFNHSCRTYGRAKHCKECGVWLALFRQAFGKSHPSGTPPVYRYTRKSPFLKPALQLQAAWQGASA